MGEIKSTLDLVMERTRHLSLTDEERTRQRRADFEKRLQGLLQQVADGVLRLEDFRNRTAGLQAEMDIEDRKTVMDAVIGRIDPHGDNAPWMTLLDHEAPATGRSLQSILEDHRLKQADILAAANKDQRDQLAGRQGISGSAVVPHPENDPTVRRRLADLERATRARIEALQDQTTR
jgi:hypothetical protein